MAFSECLNFNHKFWVWFISGSFHFGVCSYWDWISWSLTPHFWVRVWFLKICGVLHTTQKVNDLMSNTLKNSRLVQTLLATLVVCTSCLEHDALLYGSCSFCHHVVRLSRDLWRNSRWCTPLDFMCQNDPWVGRQGQNIFCGFPKGWSYSFSKFSIF